MRVSLPGVLLIVAIAAASAPPVAAQNGRNPATNALAGAGIGAAVGVIFGFAAPEACCVPLGWSQGQAAGLWAGIGAISGAGLGLLVGQLGHDPWPPWKTALTGAGIGAAGGLLAGALSGVEDATAWYAAFGGGTGLLVGAVVGLINRSRGEATGPPGGIVLRPGPTGLQIGWRASIGR